MKLPVVVGVTHSADGQYVARVPRAIKVSIGRLSGPAIHPYLSKMNDGTIGWVLEIGEGKNMTRRSYKLEQGDVLRADYLRAWESPDTPQTTHPDKLPYFTFLRDVGGDHLMHDIDVIEKHGVKPRSIEVVITDDAPLDAAYEFWKKSGLICRGDGVNAMRSIEWTPTKEDKVAAAQAKEAGFRTFPILDGCATRGCPYIRPAVSGNKEYKQCGVHGRLAFQLLSAIRLGAKAEFSTTGVRSVIQLSASLTELAAFTGGGNAEDGTVRGIPLELALNKFKTKHNGVAGSAYSVRLELRADSMGAMKSKLEEAAVMFAIAGPKYIPPKLLSAPETEEEDGVVQEAEYVDADDGPAAGAIHHAQFGGADDADEIESDPEKDEDANYAAQKAKLMAEAENAAGKKPALAGPARVADQAPPTKAPPKTVEPEPELDNEVVSEGAEEPSGDEWAKWEKDMESGGAPANYVDPGEQGQDKPPAKKTGNKLKF